MHTHSHIPCHTFRWVVQRKKLFFHCSFTTPLRQTVEITGTSKLWTMDDFVVPRAGPAEYQRVSQSLTKDTVLAVTERETVRVVVANDNDTGDTFAPPQETLMWKNFAKCVRQVETNGWSKQNDDNDKEATIRLEMTKWNQRVMDALMESIVNNGAAVDIVGRSGISDGME